VLVEGEPVNGPDPRRIFVFQENGVFPWLNVRDNVGFGLRRKSNQQREQIIAHYVSWLASPASKMPIRASSPVDAAARRDRPRPRGEPGHHLHGRAFRRARLHHPPEDARDLVRIWQAEKKTILFVTHDIEEAVQLADRVLIMSKRPATIQEVVEIDLPRPRDLDSPRYLEKRDEIFRIMGMSLRVGEKLQV
jgi:ABC-type nitrate/sulfonate/bicarbonate transport system ATPase subunit